MIVKPVVKPMDRFTALAGTPRTATARCAAASWPWSPSPGSSPPSSPPPASRGPAVSSQPVTISTQPNDGFNDVELLRKQYNGLHAYNLLIDFSGK